jgi:hypothetical protein
VPFDRIDPVDPDRSVPVIRPVVLTPVERELDRERRERARRERARREDAAKRGAEPDPGSDGPRVDLRA